MMTPHKFRLKNDDGQARLLLLALLVGIAAALAYAGQDLLPASGAPKTPSLESPADNVTAPGAATGIRVEFKWRHGGPREIANPRPQRTNHFILCAFDAPGGQECVWPGTYPANDARTPAHAWTGEPQSIPRVNIGPPGLIGQIDFRPFRERWFEYTSVQVLPAQLVNTTFQWTVGACATADNNSCTFAPNRSLASSAPNLKATDISDNLFQTTITVGVNAANTGGNNSGAFDIAFSVWRVVVKDSLVQTDANTYSSDNSTSDFNVINMDGVAVHYTSLPFTPGGGSRDISRVVAIIEPGQNDFRWFPRASNPGINPTPPGSDVAVANFYLLTQSPNPDLPNLLPADRPLGLVYFVELDPNGLVAETDEDDNTALETSVVN